MSSVIADIGPPPRVRAHNLARSLGEPSDTVPERRNWLHRRDGYTPFHAPSPAVPRRSPTYQGPPLTSQCCSQAFATVLRGLICKQGVVGSSPIVSTTCDQGLCGTFDPLPTHRNTPFMHHPKPFGSVMASRGAEDRELPTGSPAAS